MLRPNPPRMITLAAAVALVVIGFSVTVFPIDLVNQGLDLVQGYFGTNIEVTEQIGWVCLLLGNALLVAGSLLPGI